ncbi:MAG: glycerol-3-phosphate acyltransferase [Bacteroidetes bacterium]|nr:glycerol-3-phosphate acyltransferase [Bacteroidota bacterium]
MNVGLLGAALLGYAIGLVPVAFILMKLTRGKDIRTEGTGNVGAMNVYEVTGSRWIGILTFLLDALKGVAAVLLAQTIFGHWFLATAVAGAACVAGHNFNIVLGGKGGRGLATATGVFAIVNPFMILLWDIMYLTGYFVIRRDIRVASMVATLGSGVLIFSTPERVLRLTTILPDVYSMTELKLFAAATLFLIFVRFVAPMREFMAEEHEKHYSDEAE